jgi:hypothetical protein
VPAGNEVVVIASVPLLLAMLAGKVAFCGEGSESATWIVKLLSPAVVGVPLIVPVLEFNERPAGRLPLPMLHV